MTVRVLPVRDDAVLVELADLDETLALAASLEAEPIDGVVDVVPGARTLLVTFRPSAVSAGRIASAVRTRPLDAVRAGDAPLRRVPVRYDGEDLAEVAELLGVSPAEVVRRHTESEYTVSFVGFAPGFAYLTGGDPLLDVPRRTSPRTRIPAGSVALAGTYSGVYPRASPGGWQLIGTTNLPMWDLSRERPAFLEPGDRVRFDLVDAPRAAVTGSTVAEPVEASPHTVAEPVEASRNTVAEPVGASHALENSAPFDKLRDREAEDPENHTVAEPVEASRNTVAEPVEASPALENSSPFDTSTGSAQAKLRDRVAEDPENHTVAEPVEASRNTVAEPVEASPALENSSPFDTSTGSAQAELKDRVAGQAELRDREVGTQRSGLEVLSAGLQTVFQDLGRTGFTSMGVSASGALDPVALRGANRLVGNDIAEGVLEVVVGGLQLRAHGAQVVAVAGAPLPLTVVRSGERRTAPFHTAIALDDGDELHLGMATEGVRSYVAVRGGFAEETVLGSLATDALSGVGPDPVAAGRVLGVRPVSAGSIVATEAAPDRQLPRVGEETVLDIVLGPRTDWLSADAVASLTGQAWDVTPQSNRVGVRLAGEPIGRERTDELPSEGCVAGALQIPPNGQPVLFLADHPLTGGYPVIGAVVADQVALAGQLPVGARVRFRVRTPFAEIGTPTAGPSSITSDTDDTAPDDTDVASDSAPAGRDPR